MSTDKRTEARAQLTMTETTPRVRLTKPQRDALKAYEFAERQLDRYMGSVFVNAHGQRQHEAKVTAAYEACKRLGMTHEHGL